MYTQAFRDYLGTVWPMACDIPTSEFKGIAQMLGFTAWGFDEGADSPIGHLAPGVILIGKANYQTNHPEWPFDGITIERPAYCWDWTLEGRTLTFRSSLHYKAISFLVSGPDAGEPIHQMLQEAISAMNGTHVYIVPEDIRIVQWSLSKTIINLIAKLAHLEVTIKEL